MSECYSPSFMSSYMSIMLAECKFGDNSYICQKLEIFIGF